MSPSTRLRVAMAGVWRWRTLMLTRMGFEEFGDGDPVEAVGFGSRDMRSASAPTSDLVGVGVNVRGRRGVRGW